MLRHIERLRTKPKAVRIQAAFISAVVLTSLVVGVWAISLPTQIAKVKTVFVPDTSTTEVVSRPLWQKFQVALGLTALPQIATSSESTETENAVDAIVEAAVNGSTTSNVSTSTTANVSTSSASASRVVQIATTSATTSITATTTE